MPQYKEGDIYQDSKGRQVILRGGQWIPYTAQTAKLAPSPLNRLTTTYLGQPEGSNVSDFLSSVKQEFTDPKVALQHIKQGLLGLTPLSSGEAALGAMNEPGWGNKIAGAAEYALSGVPLLGPAISSSMEQARTGDVAGSMALPLQILTGKAFEAVPSMGEMGEAAHRAAQTAAGVGKGFVEDVQRKQGEALKEATRKYAEDVDATRRENELNRAQALGAHEQDVTTIDRANQREIANAAERDRLNREAYNNAQTLAKQLLTTRENAKAVAKSVYPDINGTVGSPDVHSEVQAAVDRSLKGSNRVPAVLARILSETSDQPARSTGPAIMGRTLDLSNPADLAAYQRFKASGAFTPEEITRMEGRGGPRVSAERLHGYSSEIGRELYRKDLPGDERVALEESKSVIDKMHSDLAEKEDKIYRFKEAQKIYAKMMQSFYDQNHSPIARALAKYDPYLKTVRPLDIQSILSEPKAYDAALEILSRYKEAGRDPAATLQLMRENMEEAKTLPETPKIQPKPEMARISLKQTPEFTGKPIEDPTAIRIKELQRMASERPWTNVQNLRPWRIPYSALQTLRALALRNPAIQAWLARNAP